MISREQALPALASEAFDVVVIGGGITGAGVALDAASRGYAVALVEQADFASGTSSRSSKLVHGGLRYLQNFDLGLVREALLERQLMVRLAPHLVRPLPLVVPAFDGARPDRLVGMGLNLYDVMAVDKLRGRRRRKDEPAEPDEFREWAPERHRVIPGEEVVERLPALAARNPTSGYLFYDCQTDDSRLVLTVLAEAERFGAVCANRLDRHAAGPGGRTGHRRARARRRDGRGVRRARHERRERDGRLGRPHPAGGAPRRGRGAAHRAEPRHAHHRRARPAPADRRRDRAGGGGAVDLRARRGSARRSSAPPTTTTARANWTTSARPSPTSTTCSRRRTASSGPS